MTSRSERARRRYRWRSPMAGKLPADPPESGRSTGQYWPVRILVFHGYLLRGTGSNIYNAAWRAALAQLGHEVHLLCQDRHAAELDVRGRRRALGGRRAGGGDDPRAGSLHGVPAGHRPLLPVYVADEYEGFDAAPFPDLSDERARALPERERRPRSGRWPSGAGPDVGLANHLVMGPVIFAPRRSAAGPLRGEGPRQRAEYTVAPRPERFLPYAREGLEQARRGARRVAAHGRAAVGGDGRPGLPDADAARAARRGRATRSCRAGPTRRRARLTRSPTGSRARTAAGWGGERRAPPDALRALDPGARPDRQLRGQADRLEGRRPAARRLAAVAAEVPDARLCVVGFGTYREGLERLVEALGARRPRRRARDRRRAAASWRAGRRGELRYLTAFLDGLEGERRERYLASAADGAASESHFTGRLEHDDLPDLLPACQAQVVPSTFPEAFGMVAAEAAACGALPLSAAHSGLAEVTRRAGAARSTRALRPLLVVRARARGRRGDRGQARCAGSALEPRRARIGAGGAVEPRARAIRLGGRGASGVIAAAQGRLDDASAGHVRRAGFASAERIIFAPPWLSSRDRIGALALPAALAAGLAGVGCGTHHGDHADLVNGKKLLFVQTLRRLPHARARGTKGTQGPNLDAAFVSRPPAGLPATAASRASCTTRSPTRAAAASCPRTS